MRLARSTLDVHSMRASGRLDARRGTSDRRNVDDLAQFSPRRRRRRDLEHAPQAAPVSPLRFEPVPAVLLPAPSRDELVWLRRTR
jgi:hypothetical protein